ncbi:MAG: VCBS repeat-containing protein, partial [Myxococcales bacterium]|nr:VCBS repeat-containing protein [Myxococcales bacterium]
LMPPNLLDLLDPQYFQPNMYGMVDAHVGDVDGDTKPDIVYSGVGKVDTEVAFNVGFGAAHHDEYIAADLPADHVVLGDWDGDGLAEPASLRYTGDSVVAYTFNTPARFDYEAEPVRWGRAQGTFDPEQRYLSGDFNGDDQPDVARVFADGWETSIDTHLNNGAGFSMVRGITRAGAHAAGQHFLAGDFNGDEFDDVLKVWAFNGATVFDAYYGGGAGLTAAYSVGGGGGDWGAMDYVAGDFDGDGLTDVAKLWNHDGKLIADVYRSNGPGFEDFEYWLPDSQVPYYEGAKYTVGDYNGDHRDDIARIFRDTDVNEGPIYAGAVSFGEAGSKDVVIDYFSVDVLASDGDEFAASRWVSKSALFSPDSHVVSAHMDSDELEDIVILAPTPEGTIGMVLFVSNATYFDPSLLRKDEDIGYAKDMMKVVAADFDLDGRAEIATMTRDKSSVETNFDVWGGETAPDPSLLGAAGDTSTYTKEQAIAVLASQGYTLGNGAELQDKDCTIIYPNAAEERQARDLGLLVCARDLNGAKRIYSATVYGGCDWSSGVGTCSIGRASPTVNVLGKSITITGPSAAACASITQEMVCGEVRGRFTSAAFSLSPDNVYLSGGVYVGPYAGATASFKNSVLSGSVKIDGVATLKYSLDANDVVDVGAVGFSRLYGEVKRSPTRSTRGSTRASAPSRTRGPASSTGSRRSGASWACERRLAARERAQRRRPAVDPR